MALLLVYTGDGKGKTSASTGQAVRAFGRGMLVGFAQFMKRDVQAGEQKVLKELLGDNFLIGGCGFYRNEAEKEQHRAAALEVLEWAIKRAAKLDMLVLDETLYALGSGLILQDELMRVIQACRKADTHLVLSGRGLPDWLEQEADTVTVMQEHKHHYANGIKAQSGIEF